MESTASKPNSATATNAVNSGTHNVGRGNGGAATAAGRPLSILSLTLEGIQIHLDELKSVFAKVGNNHFAVYSINGKKRTGKSFMLSNFILYLNKKSPGDNWLMDSIQTDKKSFEWRGGTERKTTGIDIWSEPFWIEKDGKQIAILLMDTQGSFDDQTTLQQNAYVFALSVLLSSTLIYNVMQDLGEDNFQYLELFRTYASATLPVAAGELDHIHADSPFQRLIFLIRDFQFIKDYKYGYYSTNIKPAGQDKNFKTAIVSPHAGQATEALHIRQQLAKAFPDIGVYLMPEPDKGLKQRDSLANLDEEFGQHVSQFVEKLFSDKDKIMVKKVGGVVTTGKEMIKYIERWAKFLHGEDGEGLPPIKAISMTMAETQYTIARDYALTFFQTQVSGYLDQNQSGVTDEQLNEEINNVKNEALTQYKSRNRLGNQESLTKFQEEFNERVEMFVECFRKINSARKEMQENKEEAERKIKDAQNKMYVGLLQDVLKVITPMLKESLNPNASDHSRIFGESSRGLTRDMLMLGLGSRSSSSSSSIDSVSVD